MGLASAHFRRMRLDGKGWSRGMIFGQRNRETPAVPLPPSSTSSSWAKNEETAAAAAGLGWTRTAGRISGPPLACRTAQGGSDVTQQSWGLWQLVQSASLGPAWWLSKCAHICRCANGTDSLSLPGRCSEMFLDGSAPTPASLPSLVCSLWEWRPMLTPKRCL